MSRDSIQIELCTRGAIVQIEGTPDRGDASVGIGPGAEDLRVIGWVQDDIPYTFDGVLTDDEEERASMAIMEEQQDQLDSMRDDAADIAREDRT